MKNIKNTTKYTEIIKVFLTIVVFAVALPFTTFAQLDESVSFGSGGLDSSEGFGYSGSDSSIIFGGGSSNNLLDPMAVFGSNGTAYPDSMSFGSGSLDSSVSLGSASLDPLSIYGSRDSLSGGSIVFGSGGYSSLDSSVAVGSGNLDQSYAFGSGSLDPTVVFGSGGYSSLDSSVAVGSGNLDQSYAFGSGSLDPTVVFGSGDNSYANMIASGRYFPSGIYSYGLGNYYGGGYYGSGVTSGSYSGSRTYLQSSPYYYSQPSWVSSGGYYGGGNSAYYPYSYYSQPVAYNYNSATPNQVLSYTNTNPNLASVYLSDIPNTGFEDYYGTLVFISLLLSWSAILAYLFLKRKINSQTTFAKAYVNTVEENVKDDSVISNIKNQIVSDHSDIKKVEEYARTNKILLSSDASARLVKLSRLGKVNASEYIRGLATGEWLAIGESQIG